MPRAKSSRDVQGSSGSLRRFLGTKVCMHSDSEAASKALGNSKPVAEKHYIKPQTAHPAVRRAMNEAASVLVN